MYNSQKYRMAHTIWLKMTETLICCVITCFVVGSGLVYGYSYYTGLLEQIVNLGNGNPQMYIMENGDFTLHHEGNAGKRAARGDDQ